MTGPGPKVRVLLVAVLVASSAIAATAALGGAADAVANHLVVEEGESI
ncbi:hypothetical protein [Halostella salina]|nr:hypothetical protein [Halostella salina]